LIHPPRISLQFKTMNYFIGQGMTHVCKRRTSVSCKPGGWGDRDFAIN
jgi:hypothetical protein